MSQRFGANISFPYTEKKTEENVEKTLVEVVVSEPVVIDDDLVNTAKKKGALKINEK